MNSKSKIRKFNINLLKVIQSRTVMCESESGFGFESRFRAFWLDLDSDSQFEWIRIQLDSDSKCLDSDSNLE